MPLVHFMFLLRPHELKFAALVPSWIDPPLAIKTRAHCTLVIERNWRAFATESVELRKSAAN